MLAAKSSSNFNEYNVARVKELAGFCPAMMDFFSGPPVSTAGFPQYFVKCISDDFETKTRPLRLLWYQARLYKEVDVIFSLETIQKSLTDGRDANCARR